LSFYPFISERSEYRKFFKFCPALPLSSVAASRLLAALAEETTEKEI
jgi:hypothetical protein